MLAQLLAGDKLGVDQFQGQVGVGGQRRVGSEQRLGTARFPGPQTAVQFGTGLAQLPLRPILDEAIEWHDVLLRKRRATGRGLSYHLSHAARKPF